MHTAKYNNIKMQLKFFFAWVFFAILILSTKHLMQFFFLIFIREHCVPCELLYAKELKFELFYMGMEVANPFYS